MDTYDMRERSLPWRLLRAPGHFVRCLRLGMPPRLAWGIVRSLLRGLPALVACLALPLAGCQEGGTGISQGGITAPGRSLLSGQSFAYQCERFDPESGAVTDRVSITNNVQPDQATIAALAAVAQAGIAKIAAAAPAVGPMAATRDQRAASPPLNVTACLGEHNPTSTQPQPPLVPGGFGQQEESTP